MARDGHTLENNNLELGLVASLDAALVGMAASLAAESVGLRGVMIGGARNDPEEVARLLDLPQRPVACTGCVLAMPKHDRRSRAWTRIWSALRIASPRASGPSVDAYDSELARHYRDAGRQTADNSWSNDVSSKFSTRPRDGLRAALRRMGFDFA